MVNCLVSRGRKVCFPRLLYGELNFFTENFRKSGHPEKFIHFNKSEIDGISKLITTKRKAYLLGQFATTVLTHERTLPAIVKSR